MEPSTFRAAAKVLAEPRGLDLVAFLRGSEWVTASEAARALSIHISTAVKWLRVLADAGLVARRSRPDHARHPWEYRLSEHADVLPLPRGDARAGERDRLLRGATSLGLPRPLLRSLEDATSDAEVRARLEEVIGAAAVRRLLAVPEVAP